MGVNLQRLVFTGIAWSGSARVIQQLAQFGFSAFLARLLLPEDFGTVSMLLVFTGFVSIFANTGLSSAIIQKAELGENHLSSAFWLNLLIGVCLALIVYAGAPLIAHFYNIPALENLARALSIGFVISPIGMISNALMQRRLQFKRLALISLTSTISSGAFGVILAAFGFGIWSLVAQTLSNLVLRVIFSILACGWRLRSVFSYAAIRELWGYAANLIGFNFINYWARNGDNLLIGRFMGASALGLYGRAYGLMLLPISQVISVVSDIMFSALSNIQDEHDRVRSIYLRALGLIALVCFPIMSGLFATAEPFILAVYGDQWAGTIPVLRILAIAGLLQSMINPVGWIYMSQGRTDWMFRRFGLAWSLAMISGIIIGIVLGSIVTVAACYTAANVLMLYPAISMSGKLIDMSFWDLAGVIKHALVSSLLMVSIVLGIDQVLSSAIVQWQRLIFLTAIGAGTYAALVFSLHAPGTEEILAFFKHRILVKLNIRAVGP